MSDGVDGFILDDIAPETVADAIIRFLDRNSSSTIEEKIVIPNQFFLAEIVKPFLGCGDENNSNS